MRILIADDDNALRLALATHLRKWGYEPLVCHDGAEARAVLLAERPPIALLDWSMPPPDGPALCAEIRQSPELQSTYVVLLTANDGRDSMVAGLGAGADEYITKPVDWEILRARVNIGVRLVGLQQSLTERIQQLQDALASVKQLKGLLPICSYCKSIRDDHHYWQQLEAYVSRHSDAQFSHGVCPSCLDRARRELGLTECDVPDDAPAEMRSQGVEPERA
jgi:phosphoserine phosphatase RsbU/P